MESPLPRRFLKKKISGELAQLARASALHAEGQRFESVILHTLRVVMLTLTIELRNRSLTILNTYKREREKLLRVHGGCLGSWRRRRT